MYNMTPYSSWAIEQIRRDEREAVAQFLIDYDMHKFRSPEQLRHFLETKENPFARINQS